MFHIFIALGACAASFSENLATADRTVAGPAVGVLFDRPLVRGLIATDRNVAWPGERLSVFVGIERITMSDPLYNPYWDSEFPWPGKIVVLNQEGRVLGEWIGPEPTAIPSASLWSASNGMAVSGARLELPLETEPPAEPTKTSPGLRYVGEPLPPGRYRVQVIFTHRLLTKPNGMTAEGWQRSYAEWFRSVPLDIHLLASAERLPDHLLPDGTPLPEQHLLSCQCRSVRASLVAVEQTDREDGRAMLLFLMENLTTRPLKVLSPARFTDMYDYPLPVRLLISDAAGRPIANLLDSSNAFRIGRFELQEFVELPPRGIMGSYELVRVGRVPIKLPPIDSVREWHPLPAGNYTLQLVLDRHAVGGRDVWNPTALSYENAQGETVSVATSEIRSEELTRSPPVIITLSGHVPKPFEPSSRKHWGMKE